MQNLAVNAMSQELINLLVYPMAPGLQKLNGLKAFANAKEVKLNDLGDFLIRRPEISNKLITQEVNLLD